VSRDLIAGESFQLGAGDIGDRQLGAGGGQSSDVAFRQVQCSFVFGAHGVVTGAQARSHECE
jgi:hypothetical protein